MSKQQIINEIQQYNRSACQEFLISFNEDDLRVYLHRLTNLAGQRGRHSGWVRPSNVPPVATRMNAA